MTWWPGLEWSKTSSLTGLILGLERPPQLEMGPLGFSGPPSLVLRHQLRASKKENQTETVLPFMAQSRKSCSITFAIFYSFHGSLEGQPSRKAVPGGVRSLHILIGGQSKNLGTYFKATTVG